MAKKVNGFKVVTPTCRANWVYLFTPRENRDPTKKPQYSVTLLLKKGEDLTALKNACTKAIIETWGTDKADWPKSLQPWPKTICAPFKDQGTAFVKGTENLQNGYEKGAIYFETKTYNQPKVVDASLRPILDANEVYSGCYIRASVVFKSYDFQGNQGITTYLQHIQKVKEGEPLAGFSRPEDDFEAIVDDTVSDDDSFEGIENAEAAELLG